MPNTQRVHTKFFKELEKTLSIFGNKYFSPDGSIARSAVLDDLELNDKELIGAIINNKYFQENYSVPFKNSFIFNGDEFKTALSQREYVYDGLTNYRNQIGLSVLRRPLDSFANENIELDFPYKDTVLKAGMDKSDAKRSTEPYLNKIIAKDEINALVEPKAFRNTEVIGDVDAADPNLLIKGNNLIALYSLAKRYSDAVKLIYVDVPYYFKEQKETDSFLYNSNFKLSTWLVFMENRLQEAFKLLKDDGSIWIHVGEDGMHYLKVLCDQIFSPENYVGTLPRKTRDGKSDVPFNFSQDFDWILVYTKTTNSDKAIVGRKVQRKYYETPDFPGRKWRTADLTKQTTTKERPNSDFTMVNPKTGKEYPVNPDRSWAVTKDTFLEWYDRGGIGFPDDYDFMKGHRPFRRVFKDEDDKKDKLSSVSSDLLLKDFIKTLLAKSKTTKKDEYVKKQQFNYAKPEELMKQIISVTTKEGDYVMDFFSGSGTTAAAALKMNRRFIAVEQIDEQLQLSKKRLNSVVKNEDKGGISKEVDWKGGSGFIYTELASKKENLIDQINAATTIDELTQIAKLIGDDDYQLNIDINKVWQNLDQVTVNDVKNAMVDILEPAQLYVSALNVDDPEEHISEKDRNFTKAFYAGDKVIDHE
ncbi:site-specific DNA-methyltransferase [Limosilactobacillus fermentum]|uniref:site-specific DNA-methyltransferase n=1 Tax=Limosilactobacillus fermentum TaxID=1613 RepID=UPI002F265AE1